MTARTTQLQLPRRPWPWPFSALVSALARTRAAGAALALIAALVSGVAVFVNGYGVHAVKDATVYTTAKNLVAAVLLGALAALATARRSPARLTRPRGRRQWAGLAVVAVVGGSVPFVLFFEGLARASSVQAAFIQKTLVVWVALLGCRCCRSGSAGRIWPPSGCWCGARRSSVAGSAGCTQAVGSC